MKPRRHPHQEIVSKVELALEAIALGNRQVGLPHHLTNDLFECLMYDEEELWDKLPNLLQELLETGPIHCYIGKFPPMPAEERGLLGLELWAYHWYSGILNMDVYLKFCIEFNPDQKPVYLHARIHQDRP